MTFESKGGPKRETKKEKTCFVSWKTYFSCYFFNTPFPLHLEDEF
jgi:hypothetical protein